MIESEIEKLALGFVRLRADHLREIARIEKFRKTYLEKHKNNLIEALAYLRNHTEIYQYENFLRDKMDDACRALHEAVTKNYETSQDEYFRIYPYGFEYLELCYRYDMSPKELKDAGIIGKKHLFHIYENLLFKWIDHGLYETVDNKRDVKGKLTHKGKLFVASRLLDIAS